MTESTEETRDGVIFLKKIITYDKLFGSATLVAIVGIIWWAAVTDTKVDGHEIRMDKIEATQVVDRAKVDAVVATPTMNTEQIKALQENSRQNTADIKLIFTQLTKKDSSQILMLKMVTYLYNKNIK